MHRPRWIACAVLACALASLTGCELPAYTRSTPQPPRPEARPDRLVRGAVTAVDAGQQVVVLDVGWRQGVKRDWPFIVYRGEDYVGTVVVDAVFPNVCGARYAADMHGHPTTGDRVATRLLAP